MSMASLDMLSTSEAAEALDLTEGLIARYCREGRLGQKVGNRWVIFRQELEQFEKIPRKPGRKPHKESA